MVTLFAVAAGLAVANIYYAQPLLTAIASAFHVGSGTASLVITVGTAATSWASHCSFRSATRWTGASSSPPCCR